MRWGRKFKIKKSKILIPTERIERAIQVNIAIVRAFVRLRQLLTSNAGLARKLVELEHKYDKQFKAVFETIRRIMIPPKTTREQIGFKVKN